MCRAHLAERHLARERLEVATRDLASVREYRELVALERRVGEHVDDDVAVGGGHFLYERDSRVERARHHAAWHVRQSSSRPS